MLTYVLSLAVGLGVGVLYAFLGVRSPAPPIVALTGLLGMVGGEQIGMAMKARLWPPAATPTPAAMPTPPPRCQTPPRCQPPPAMPNPAGGSR